MKTKKVMEILSIDKENVEQVKPSVPKMNIPLIRTSSDKSTIRIIHGTLYPSTTEHTIRKYTVGTGYSEEIKEYYITQFELEDVDGMDNKLQSFIDKVPGTILSKSEIMHLFNDNDLNLCHTLDLIEILNEVYKKNKSMFVRSIDWFEKIKDFDKIFEKYDVVEVRVDFGLDSIYLNKDRSILFNGYSKNLPWTLSDNWVISIPVFNNDSILKYDLNDLIKTCEEYIEKLDGFEDVTSKELVNKYENIVKLCKGARSVLNHVLLTDKFNN